MPARCNTPHELERERRLLQGVIILACLLPIAAGLAGIILGPAMIETASVGVNVDSHFRYLSGVLLAIGLAFLSLVRQIETETIGFRLLTLLVFVGGLARLGSVAAVGIPGRSMLAALVMEVAITPLLCLWQGSLARRFQCSA
jgi:hypothetical protein